MLMVQPRSIVVKYSPLRARGSVHIEIADLDDPVVARQFPAEGVGEEINLPPTEKQLLQQDLLVPAAGYGIDDQPPPSVLARLVGQQGECPREQLRIVLLDEDIKDLALLPVI